MGGWEGGRQKVGNGDWLWRCIMCPVRAQCCWTNTRSRIKAEGRRGEERGGGRGEERGGERERPLCGAGSCVEHCARTGRLQKRRTRIREWREARGSTEVYCNERRG